MTSAKREYRGYGQDAHRRLRPPLEALVGREEREQLHRDGVLVAAQENDREQELGPEEDERQKADGHEAGDDQGQRDAPHRPEPRATIDAGRLLDIARDLVEEALHHPDDERDAEHRVDQDHPLVGVDEVQVAEDEKQRDREDDRRQELDREDPEREVLAAGAELRDAVGGERADDHRGRCRRGGDDQAVDERDLAGTATAARSRLASFRACVPHVRVAERRPIVRDPVGRARRPLGLRPEGQQQQPDDRRQEHEQRKPEQRPARAERDDLAPREPAPPVGRQPDPARSLCRDDAHPIDSRRWN